LITLIGGRCDRSRFGKQGENEQARRSWQVNE
jgi:hypothetical protein